MPKPKPKRPTEEQKKIEKTKVELKRRIPQEFQDFGESKKSTNLSHAVNVLTITSHAHN